MRTNWVLLLFAVLGFGIHSPTANAEGFVDVTYDIELGVNWAGTNPIADAMAGVMTIRYDHAGTGTGTTIAAGGAQMRSMSASGPIVLNVPGVLAMVGTTWLTMGTGDVGTWGTSIPFDNASFTKASGLNLPGINGLMTSPSVSCINGGYPLITTKDPGNGCTDSALMPVSQNPHTNPVPFTGKVIKGYGNFNTAGPPPTLSFRTLSGVSMMTHNIALSMIGLPIPTQIVNLVGTETSRTYVVPEPNMALLFGGAIIGLACVGSMRRRKR